METLGEQQSKTTDDKKPKIPFPSEIIEDIFTRLPVKSILRFRSVSKPWLSRLSHPSFTKLHFTRATSAHRTALFFSAYDCSTRKRHFLSAAHDGGPVTHLMTVDDPCSSDVTEADHLNGLVFFKYMSWPSKKNFQYVLNPSTHRIFELPHPTASLTNCSYKNGFLCYLFGFDESRNEHKILMIRQLVEPTRVEVMIFSMSSYTWRKIHVEIPPGFSWDFLRYSVHSVCVNSVVYLMTVDSYDILAFDLITHKFSIIGTPEGVVPHEHLTLHTWNGKSFYKANTPCIIKINGCIGVVCHDRVVESNEMHIWILKDYENRVWVEETITFPKPWVELDHPYPLDAMNMDEIIFSLSKVSENVIGLLVYNMKSRRFKSLQLTLGHQFLCSKTVQFNQIKGYVESILPL